MHKGGVRFARIACSAYFLVMQAIISIGGGSHNLGQVSCRLFHTPSNTCLNILHMLDSERKYVCFTFVWIHQMAGNDCLL